MLLSHAISELHTRHRTRPFSRYEKDFFPPPILIDGFVSSTDAARRDGVSNDDNSAAASDDVALGLRGGREQTDLAYGMQFSTYTYYIPTSRWPPPPLASLWAYLL